MNTAAKSVVTQRAAASNKIFNRLRQIWMRGFVFELNGRESGDRCELMEIVCGLCDPSAFSALRITVKRRGRRGPQSNA